MKKLNTEKEKEEFPNGFDAWDILFDKIVKDYDYEEITVGLLNYLIDAVGPAKTIEIVKKAKKYM